MQLYGVELKGDFPQLQEMVIKKYLFTDRIKGSGAGAGGRGSGRARGRTGDAAATPKAVCETEAARGPTARRGSFLL